MFLKSLKVKNYRCLQDVSLDFDDTTILIGENNSGKTACLDIIKNILSRVTPSAVFNEYDYYLDDNNKCPQESEGIEVIFVFREQREEEWNSDLLSKFQPVTQSFKDVITGAELFQITFRIVSKYDKASEQFELSYSFLNTENDPLLLKNQSLITDFLKTNPVFYLQALRDSTEVFSGNSYMWGKFLKQVKFKPEDLRDLHISIEALNASIISKDTSLSELVKSMDKIEKVLEFDKSDIVTINALPLQSWDLLSKAQVTLKNNENLSLPIDRYGQGTQSLVVILLYEAYISILLKKIYNKHAQAILTLEEPEAHLHPQAIRALEKQLSQIKVQKIITTHSPYFIQNIDVYSIRLFRRYSGKTSVLSIARSAYIDLANITPTIHKIVEKYSRTLELKNTTLIAKESIDEPVAHCLTSYFTKIEPDKIALIKALIQQSNLLFSTEEKNQLNIFVQKTRGEIFFAKGWFMAEGQTEAVLLPYFARILDLDFDENGISYIDYRSNGSAKSFVKLARVLDFKWVLLADNDVQGSNTISEIKSVGVTEAEITVLVWITQRKDIERELINSGFLADYEAILSSDITSDISVIKSRDLEKYKEKIAELAQAGNGKVSNAYKLVAQLECRGMRASEIPTGITDLIKRMCNNG
jgi:putative ATP-dependent endonuclease of the OLD family